MTRSTNTHSLSSMTSLSLSVCLSLIPSLASSLPSLSFSPLFLSLSPSLPVSRSRPLHFGPLWQSNGPIIGKAQVSCVAQGRLHARGRARKFKLRPCRNIQTTGAARAREVRIFALAWPPPVRAAVARLREFRKRKFFREYRERADDTVAQPANGRANREV